MAYLYLLHTRRTDIRRPATFLWARCICFALLFSLAASIASADPGAPGQPAGRGGDPGVPRQPAGTGEDPVTVTHKAGSSHGFVVLKDASGKLIAVGDQINITRRSEVRSRLVIRFRDGSIDDERTVFTQGKVLQLITDHHIQKGPSFKQPLDQEINVRAGTVTYHEFKDGKDQVNTEHMDLPPDLANGMISDALKNFPANAAEMKVAYIAGSKPRIVHLSIKPDGDDPFYVAGIRHRAKRYNIHIEIGGVAGVVAPVIGKQPPDIKMWIMDGEVPTFLKMQGELDQQGPIWTMELASPAWPSSNQNRSK